MGIFDGLKRKLRKNKETETPKRTKDAITTSTEKTETQKQASQNNLPFQNASHLQNHKHPQE